MKRPALAATMTIVAVSAALTTPAYARPLGRPGKARVQVAAAHDLFQTDPNGTHYGPVHFQGVKGCALFPEAKNTDTVVQRKQTATAASPRTEIQARCLQLQGAFLDPSIPSAVFQVLPNGMVRVGPVTLPVQGIFVTLQTDRGRHPADARRDVVAPAKPSVGNLDFTFGPSGCGGTFDSDLHVYFDVRAGAINGPIVYSADENVAPFFHSYNTPWGCSARRNEGGFVDAAQSICPPITTVDCIITDEHKVGAPADLLRGVNFLMNGRGGTQDFFPMQLNA